MKKRFSEAKIIGFLREAEAGMPVMDLCRRHGISEALFQPWRSRFGGVGVSDAKRLKEVEAENARLKKLLAKQIFRERRHQGRSPKKALTEPAKRELVRQMMVRGLSERRALRAIRMSPSAFRYAPRPDRNVELRAEIVALTHRHKRYGVGMIPLNLRKAGRLVKELCGKAMHEWAYLRGVKLRLIESGKPNQNAYVESFNGRFRDEYLNEYWFTTVLHARTVIESWRREHNDQRPKKARGGLTPAAYAKRMAEIT